MPIYDYACPACGERFSHYWRSWREAAAAGPPSCPACGHAHARRIVSPVAVLGQLGGLTPAEQEAEKRQYERMASILPKETIDKLRAGKKKAQESGS